MEKIAARLDDRFRLLTHGDRTALPRQQTLRALIDWSYELLGEDERAVFRRLAVFAGGFTLEAAEAVSASGAVGNAQVLELVTQLAEKSLVVIETARERYSLLETVRQYAAERLGESQEEDAARSRHLAYYVALAEKARPGLTGARQVEWLDRLDIERENLLAAHAWCDRAAEGSELGLKLASLVRPYWFRRGLLDLGHRVTVEALARGTPTRSFARCRGLFEAGQMSAFMGRYGEAQKYLEESLAVARHIDDRRRVAVVLQPLGMAYLGQGELATARRYLEEALASAETLGEPREIAAALNALGQLCRVEGGLHAAGTLHERFLAIARELEDRELIAIGLLNLAMLAIGREAGDHARRLLLEALAIAVETGSKAAGQSVLEVAAGLAATRHEVERAARFFGSAEAQAAQSGFRRDPADEIFLKPLVAKAQAALGSAAFAAAEEAGRLLRYEAAIADARAWLVGSG